MIVTKTDIHRGLIGRWGYRGGGSVAASGTVKDYSGQTGNAILYSTATVSNQGINLDGSGYGIAPDSGLPTGTNPKSVNIWLKPSAVGDTYHIVCGYGTAGAGEWFGIGSRVTSGNIYVTQYGDDLVGNALSVDTWINIAVTYDGSLYRLYENGSFVNSKSMTTNTQSGGSFYIGRQWISGSYYWKGKINDVRIYNRALSEEEIKFLFNQGKWRV